MNNSSNIIYNIEKKLIKENKAENLDYVEVLHNVEDFKKALYKALNHHGIVLPEQCSIDKEGKVLSFKSDSSLKVLNSYMDDDCVGNLVAQWITDYLGTPVNNEDWWVVYSKEGKFIQTS